MTGQQRLQGFLYILMRDKLNTGAVEAAMEHLRECDKNEATGMKFSAPHLAAYAMDLTNEILGELVEIKDHSPIVNMDAFLDFRKKWNLK